MRRSGTETKFQALNRPIKGESKWVDFDEETLCWGIFGTDSGFCYSLHLDEKTAETKLAEG